MKTILASPIFTHSDWLVIFSQSEYIILALHHIYTEILVYWIDLQCHKQILALLCYTILILDVPMNI